MTDEGIEHHRSRAREQCATPAEHRRHSWIRRSRQQRKLVSFVLPSRFLRSQCRPYLSSGPGSWDPIIKYIKDQHSAYLRKELTAMRDKHIVDTRIHCCLYFIAPTGHTLKAIDILVMKKLSEVVNVVPVIAKSDSLTLEEREAFKERASFALFESSV